MTDNQVTQTKTNITDQNMTKDDIQKQNSLLKYMVEKSQTFDIYKKTADIYPKLLNPSSNKAIVLIVLGGLTIIGVLLYSLPSGIGLVTKYIFGD